MPPNLLGSLLQFRSRDMLKAAVYEDKWREIDAVEILKIHCIGHLN